MNKYKKHTIGGSIILTLCIIISIFAMIPIQKNYRVNPWMKNVGDDRLITTMSIPGTHDSGATHSIFDVAGKCQDLDIEAQLEIGVRFFDIRLQQVNDKFNVVHSFVDQKLDFEDVVEDMVDFIEDYPSEFLLVSIKEDADSKNSYKDFQSLLLSYLDEEEFCFDSTLPKTLKEARGKIYILSRFNSTIGINAYEGWEDSTTFALNDLYVQDNYSIDDINIKKKDIESTINFSKDNKDKLVLNFTSCYLNNAFPPTYAGTAALTINPWLINKINNNKDTLGIIVADFINKELAESIYMRNY